MKQKLRAEKGKLYLNDDEFLLRSGAVHYFRIHPTQWRMRLEKLKKCGLNTVETYIPWNMTEPKNNEFCFEGMADFERFIEIAEELGLYVIIRPGPYICAEWEMGGLPSWLLAIKGIRLRHNNEQFLYHVERYFAKVIEILKPHFSTNGGNVIAIQAENEYGGLGEIDNDYLNAIYNMLIKLGVDVLIFTSDGLWGRQLENGCIDNVLMTANFGSKAKEAFERLDSLRPDEPDICMEFWNGWFDQWGVEHHTRDPKEPVSELRDMLECGGHFNIYMFSGGTNFGFWNGSNCNPHFEPCITSYDYGAAIGEDGRITQQYKMIAQLLGSQGCEDDHKSMAYGMVTNFKVSGLFENKERLGKRISSPDALSMEDVGQRFGYILYEMDIEGMSGEIDIGEPHDRAMFWADGEFLGEYERGLEYEMITVSGKKKLSVFIENMGRVNFGKRIFDRKGLLQNVKIGDDEVVGYEITSFELENGRILTESKNTQYPALYTAEFEVKETADTYLLPEGFTKGVAFINGFNLGRYWSKGPQQTLYVPEGVLKKGINTLTILDLYKPNRLSASLVSEHILDELK